MRTIAIAFLATALLGCDSSEAGSEAPDLAPATLQSLRDADEAPLVIDVRSAEEYAAGHIPGALNIPFDRVAQRISDLDAPRGVALYCLVGPRARKGEAALSEAGYRSVFHLEGGFAAWQAAGLPVERVSP